MKPLFAILSLLLLFQACQKKRSSSETPSTPVSADESQTGEGTSTTDTGIDVAVPPIIEEDKFHGTYLATLKTLNKKITGTITGALTLFKEGDLFVGDVRVSGSAPNIIHAQSIHTGRCPSEEHDENKDGIIDAAEADIVLGSQVIPLDGDLNAQLAEYGIYPVSDQYGGYIYSENASFQKFFGDLLSPDERASDDISKVSPDEDFNLVGKSVIIRGIAETTLLPSTVASAGGLANFQSIPIACGIIKRVTSVPGHFNEEDPNVDIAPPNIGGETVGGSSGVADGTLGEEVEEEATSGGISNGETTTGEITAGGSTTGGNYGDDEET